MKLLVMLVTNRRGRETYAPSKHTINPFTMLATDRHLQFLVTRIQVSILKVSVLRVSLKFERISFISFVSYSLPVY